MKKLLFAILAAGTLAACSKDEPIHGPTTHTITFEEAYYAPFVASTYAPGKPFSHDVTGSDYPGTLIWTDPVTHLSTEYPSISTSSPNRFGYDYPFFVSNYNSSDLPTHGNSSNDLYVYSAPEVKAGGRNGSANFLIGYGYKATYGDERPILRFSDNKPHAIQSIFINSTCYFLNETANGKDALKIGEKVEIHATGFDADGKEGKTISLTIASRPVEMGGKLNLITEWTKWDLSELGLVAAVKFDQSGKNNEYGYALPAYIAIDDVTIEM